MNKKAMHIANTAAALASKKQMPPTAEPVIPGAEQQEPDADDQQDPHEALIEAKLAADPELAKALAMHHIKSKKSK